MPPLNSTKGLSIDNYIILPQDSAELEIILDKVALRQGFIRKQLQQRTTENKIEKAHYKFFNLTEGAVTPSLLKREWRITLSSSHHHLGNDSSIHGLL